MFLCKIDKPHDKTDLYTYFNLQSFLISFSSCRLIVNKMLSFSQLARISLAVVFLVGVFAISSAEAQSISDLYGSPTSLVTSDTTGSPSSTSQQTTIPFRDSSDASSMGMQVGLLAVFIQALFALALVM